MVKEKIYIPNFDEFYNAINNIHIERLRKKKLEQRNKKLQYIFGNELNNHKKKF